MWHRGIIILIKFIKFILPIPYSQSYHKVEAILGVILSNGTKSPFVRDFWWLDRGVKTVSDQRAVF
jgi:hypothetical protein